MEMSSGMYEAPLDELGSDALKNYRKTVDQQLNALKDQPEFALAMLEC